MTSRTTILTARRLLTDIGSIEFPVITVAADGTIADISSDVPIQSDTTLVAAFLDIHTHGAVGVDVMSATPAELGRLGRFYATHGVAHYLPTTATAPLDATLTALDGLATAIESFTPAGRPGEAQPLGIHLEGPFLSHAKRGVHPEALLRQPSIEVFDRFWQAARGRIALVTLAPELPGALDLIRHLATLGVRISLGHTDATAAQALAAIEAGATSATHTFNAMRPLDHREPGILGTVLDPAQTTFSELICDGVHVAPPLVRLWWAATNAGIPNRASRSILVTDSMAAAGSPDGEYTLAGLPVTVAGGVSLLTEDLARGKRTIAGSVLTLDAAVHNLQRYTGATLAQATAAASHTPARLLGRAELTRLAPGFPAHLNRFAADGTLLGTWLHGRPVAPLS